MYASIPPTLPCAPPVGRRLLVVVLLALVACVAAAAARAVEPPDWWPAHVGADPAQAPGPGVPIALIDSGVDATPPGVRRPARHHVPQRPEHGGRGRLARHRRRPSTALSIYPRAALDIWDISPGGDLNVPAAVAAIVATAQHCPRVISLSFEASVRDASLADAIATAQHNGCLVVASAGNGGTSGAIVYPASLPHVLSVGSTDENDAVASFSSVSQSIDLVAPGVDILAAVPTWRKASGFETENGTSFSAPIVSAAAAWLWTVRPTLTAFQVAAILRSTAHDISSAGFDPSSGYGIVNVPAALAAPTPASDPAEPNDDVDEVKPGALFSARRAAR